MEVHDIHDFVVSSQRMIEDEYARIQKRATEDPGTAGDQGEENWASLLRLWLPSYFHIVTKGRILTESGYASPQVDLIVLMPSYPKILQDKKLYLAGGVAAAFECKTTLKADHIRAALKTSSALRQNIPRRQGSPYKELNSTTIYGLLAHSHSWKGSKSTPVENITGTLLESDLEFVHHPVECLDFICVADLATWSVMKHTYIGPSIDPSYSDEMVTKYGKEGSAQSVYMCGAIQGDRQEAFLSPLGALLSGLYTKLAWTFPDMRNLEEYFRKVNLRGSGEGRARIWDLSIYSDKVRQRVCNGMLAGGNLFDEWAIFFF